MAAHDDNQQTNRPSPLPPVATIRISQSSNCSHEPSTSDKFRVGRRRKSRTDSSYVPSISDEEHGRGNKRVCMLRGAVILTLLTATVLAASLTYVFVREEENRTFVGQYEDSVAKVAQAFQSGLDAKHDAVETLAAVYTSYFGSDSQYPSVWPNVTMPNFEAISDGLVKLGDARSITFSPIITQGVDRLSWEAYAEETASSLKAPRLFEAESGTEMQENRTVGFGIYAHDLDTNEIVYDAGYAPSSRHPEILVPVWQVNPAETNEMVMLNLHSEERPHRMRALDDLLTHDMEVLTAIVQLEHDEELRPSSVMFYPVFDEFGVHHNYRSSSTGHVRGAIGLEFSWDDSLSKILPEYIKGMICVLKTSIGQTYSYSISGDQVTLMGEGDYHDPKYDHLRHTSVASMDQIEVEHAVVDNLITYSLTMYPSQELEDQYVTNRAAIYTAGVVLIFMFTAGLFLLYDYLVESRQQRTARLARQTSNIVDGMFPATFRDRLYKRHDSGVGTMTADNDVAECRRECNDTERTYSKSIMSHGAIKTLKQIDKFMKNVWGSDNNMTMSAQCCADEPIADLFLETSIMFADIVGFTKWSSERSPHEVFKLLERLFWEFDGIADRLNVFKLGTIGDCYIAVTGIPEPVNNHATLLTQFAFECRDKVKEVCADLDAEGLDTEKLDMRFGIHSGSITAGILRGKKSRFELFGDTINTASRMESTGKAGMIQLSEETAELIRFDNMGKWLRKREDKITAKGKGELQTFWAEIMGDSKDARRVSFSDDLDDLMTNENLKSSMELDEEKDLFFEVNDTKSEDEDTNTSEVGCKPSELKMMIHCSKNS